MDAGLSQTVAIGPTSSFGQEHFGDCILGDKRLTARAVITADALMRHPGGTLPAKLPKAELCGFYDFANNVKVNHDNVLDCHCRRTRELAEQCAGTMLFIHDTTEGDYSGLTIGNLGPIGNGYCRGMLIHNVLAMDYGNRQALGLMGQILQIRRKVEKNESVKTSRKHPQRESRLWPKGVEAVGRRARKTRNKRPISCIKPRKETCSKSSRASSRCKRPPQKTSRVLRREWSRTTPSSATARTAPRPQVKR